MYFSNGGGIAATALRLVDSIVSDNLGGGIFVNGDAELKNSTVTRNRGFLTNTGGGLSIRGTLTMRNSTVSDNTAGAERSIGGGLFIDGSAKIDSSTISGNNAWGDIGVGGGVLLFDGDLTLINTTVSGNTARGGTSGVSYAGSGGGIFSSALAPTLSGPAGPVVLIHSTVTNNIAFNSIGSAPPIFYQYAGTGGGLFVDTLSVTNSLVAGNVASNGAGDCVAFSPVTFSGLNVVGDGSCDAASQGQLTGDPLLGPLANNGGSTLTHAPQAGSIVIGQIGLTRNGKCAFSRLIDDQNGSLRVADGACDIGAVEYTPTASTLKPASY